MFPLVSDWAVTASLVLDEDLWDVAGLHRTAPGVTEQLVDCSGGDVRNEDTGFARKAEALTRIMAAEVRDMTAFPSCCQGLPLLLAWNRIHSLLLFHPHAAFTQCHSDIEA
jgi:hypothetical protein